MMELVYTSRVPYIRCFSTEEILLYVCTALELLFCFLTLIMVRFSQFPHFKGLRDCRFRKVHHVEYMKQNVIK